MHSGFGVLRDRCTMNVGIRVRLNEIPPALARDIARLNELWTEGLNRFGGPFLAGKSFTAVDAFFTSVAFRIQTYDLKLDQAAAAYAARLLALPSLAGVAESGARRNMARAGPRGRGDPRRHVARRPARQAGLIGAHIAALAATTSSAK